MYFCLLSRNRIVMESAFTYNCTATGLNFLSRKKELNQFVSLLGSGKNIVIYEPPRTGKSSLIETGFSALAKSGAGLRTIHFNLQRNISKDMLRDIFAEALENTTGNAAGIMDGTGVLQRLSEIPASSEGNERIVLYIEEFQNIMKIEEWEDILHGYEKEWHSCKNISFIFTGSSVNSMKYIFEERKFFYNLFERIKLSPIEEKAVSDHIIKTFLRVGRVVEPRHTERIYEVTDGHPWYIWQIANTCFNLTKGYLVDSIIEYAIDSVLSLHEVRFKEIINSLSYYQILLLKAIFEGKSKVNSSSVIEEYGLNSSANVHRLKEALTKKEVVIFDHQGNPAIIDPMFRLWLERNYFIQNRKL